MAPVARCTSSMACRTASARSPARARSSVSGRLPQRSSPDRPGWSSTAATPCRCSPPRTAGESGRRRRLGRTSRSGGFMYSPTTSTSFCSKCGSLEILKVSTFHGLRLWSDQIPATASLPMPSRRASDRVVQCVEPSAAFSCCVIRTTSDTVPGGNEGLRPRPLAMTPTPSIPFSAKRARHRRMASESTLERRAISSLPRPSAAHNSARAWTTLRWASDDEVATRCSSLRCESVSGSATAVMTGIATDYHVISPTDH